MILKIGRKEDKSIMKKIIILIAIALASRCCFAQPTQAELEKTMKEIQKPHPSKENETALF